MSNRRSLKRNILLPIVAGLFLLLAGFTALLYLSHKWHLNETRARDRQSVERFFNARLKADADVMSAAAYALARDPVLRAAFLTGDRARLQTIAQPTFEQLQQQHRITHMYFVTPDRVALLRMHRPEAFGDTIPRITMANAGTTGRLSYGLEIGRLRGLFTLRVVLPWHDEAGKLIGYLELGEEFENFADELKRVLGVELFVAIQKELLDREAWEAGMRMFGRTPSWDQFPSVVLADYTMEVPAALADHFRLARSGPEPFIDLKVGKQRFFGATLPLRDVTAKEVGELVILRDHAGDLAGIRRGFMASAALALLLCIVFTVLFYDRARRFFIAPILELRTVSEGAGRGELLEVGVAQRKDELGDLARSINRMILDLRAAQAEQTRLILDAALDAVVTFDQVGQVTDWNRQAESLFSCPRKEAIGKSVIDLVGGGSIRTELERALQSYPNPDDSSSFNRLIEGRIQARCGKQVPVEMAITPVHGSDGLVFSAFIRDVSERTRLQEDLQAAQRLDAIGKLAGGIAHDFNNMITAIVGYVTTVEEALTPGSQAHDDAQEIRRAADRASELVQQLLAFARKRVVQPRAIDCNELVTRVERMLRRLLGDTIKLETQLDPALWAVTVDPVQLEQVMVNLSVNARDAMPDGGVITIKTANIVISGSRSAEAVVPPGNYVMITVADTGIGMDQDTMSHIFEPFFTTKTAGKGTGLGLATCYGIVKQANGYIRVASVQHRGTTFRVYLPRSEAPVLSPGTKNGSAKSPETVLLVEDEYQVRRLIERALQQEGYEIITASNGAEAVAIHRDREEPIHVLITDVVMPEMGGRECARQIRADRPDIRVIYMSGYSEELNNLQAELTETAAFIAKPFSPSELRRLVRELLDVVTV